MRLPGRKSAKAWLEEKQRRRCGGAALYMDVLKMGSGLAKKFHIIEICVEF